MSGGNFLKRLPLVRRPALFSGPGQINLAFSGPPSRPAGVLNPGTGSFGFWVCVCACGVGFVVVGERVVCEEMLAGCLFGKY